MEREGIVACERAWRLIPSSQVAISLKRLKLIEEALRQLCYAMQSRLIFFLFLPCLLRIDANEDAKRLFDDLLRNYNRLRRPVTRPDEKIVVKLKLRLSQIIDVHEKSQIMITSVWLNQEWQDPNLKWRPEDYGGVRVLYVPSEMIWVPDLVLYNNADSDYQITINTKATVHYNGTVRWTPPAIYKSLCQIDVQWFPFDTQTCDLKFGCWTYDYSVLDLQHMDDSGVMKEVFDPKTGHYDNVTEVTQGLDICNYYESVEWEILGIPAKRYIRHYQSCCDDSEWVDITYLIELRRKPLFYMVNLILPCVGISFLTILVFYLPSDSGEKVTLSISILVSLTVFFLLLTEIIPATSVVLPLIGKYLLFTMVMVTLSVIVTVVALNFHFRTPTTHRMPEWVKVVFLKVLPKYLFMKRPDEENEKEDSDADSLPPFVPSAAPLPSDSDKVAPGPVSRTGSIRRESMKALAAAKQARRTSQNSSAGAQQQFLDVPDSKTQQRMRLEALYKSPPVLQAFENICFIAELLKKQEKDDQIDDDWKYVAMVLDRLFLWFFSLACLAGTLIILMQSPHFTDYRQGIDSDSAGCRNRTV